MKLKFLHVLVFSFCLLAANAQLLTWTPEFVKDDNATVEITVDATRGNMGLMNYANTSDVYVHTGVITNLSTSSSDWKYVKFGSTPNLFNTPVAGLQATYLGNNKWKYTITGGIRAFYGVPAGETIQKVTMLFRSGNGTTVQRNSDGGDMYIPAYDNSLQVRLNKPNREPRFVPWVEPITVAVGGTVPAVAVSSTAANLELEFNGASLQTAASATNITANATVTASGNQVLVAKATVGATTKTDTIRFFVAPANVTILPLPNGVRDGINYETDATAVTLVLYAPNKTRVSIVSELNNWQETSTYQMNKTPDGNRWWLRLTGLTPGQEYAYQYLVDGVLKIGDPYCEKILDQFNDQYITSATYPNLKPYPAGLTTGNVSIFQTNKPAYTFTATNYVRPDKRNLIVYEMLVRDFVATQNWNTVRDTLSYLKRLGINTIEIMPFNEFEGNNSWGYNPNYYLAPDKAYGTENALKQFVDECHKKGIAVVLDIAMNHSFGTSPYVQLWWDAALNAPAANNPFYNTYARHAFNVGFDFNHESQATKDYVDRVIEHWLNVYKLDGFRWDLSKGFTQTQTCNATGGACDVGAWGNYDASRVAIWQRIYNKMQSTSANSYCILEHLGVDAEELDLAGRGMLLWGKMTDNYNQSTMGFNTGNDISRTLFYNHGFASPHLVGYMESHDEERIMYKNINFGNQANAAHNVRDLNVGLKRTEAAQAFLLTMPGPKMIWQFGELGYDYSINTCPNGSINNNCRTDPKPIRWDYQAIPARKALFDATAKMNALRNFPPYFNAWIAGQANITSSLGGVFKTFVINSTALKVVVVGNFDVFAQIGQVTFPTAGTYYDYMNNSATFNATGAQQNISLQPGEYKIYTDVNANQQVTPVISISNPTINFNVSVGPTPVAGTANIYYELPAKANVTINLLSGTGQQLGQLFSGNQAKGKQQLKFTKVNSMATGMYLLQFVVDGKVKTHKFIVE
jgi:1,4-alpha-glucan branching enzyme